MFRPTLESLEYRMALSGCLPKLPSIGQVTVMQYNLDEGTDYLPILGLLESGGGASDLPAAVSATFNQVATSDIGGRMKLVADQIAAGQPDLVALEEVTAWDVNGTTRYDLLGSLLTDLAADGQHYTAEVKAVEVNSPVALADAQGNLISFHDYNVILARTDLPSSIFHLSNPQQGTYSAYVPLSLPGPNGPIPVNITRSWASVDVQMWGEQFRFLMTHLETFNATINELQAEELLAGPANTPLPVILAGDFNATPDSPAYADTIQAGFQDAWTQTHPTDPGYTWGPTGETTRDFNQRIDYVFARGAFHVQSALLVGTDPNFITAAGRYPSDHLGVLATYTLPGYPTNDFRLSLLRFLELSWALTNNQHWTI